MLERWTSLTKGKGENESTKRKESALPSTGRKGKDEKKKRKADLKTEGKIGALQFRAKHSHDGPIARRHTDALVRG